MPVFVRTVDGFISLRDLVRYERLLIFAAAVEFVSALRERSSVGGILSGWLVHILTFSGEAILVEFSNF